MARALVDGMTSEWEPERYHDDYREKLEQVIEEKIEHPDTVPKGAPKTRKPTKIVDLVSVLQRSIDQATASRGKHRPHTAARHPHPAHKRAA